MQRVECRELLSREHQELLSISQHLHNLESNWYMQFSIEAVLNFAFKAVDRHGTTMIDIYFPLTFCKIKKEIIFIPCQVMNFRKKKEKTIDFGLVSNIFN